MTKKFQNKYRIPSARMPHWDYGKDAAYFITICTQDRACFFGTITDQKMTLNNSGQMAQNIWMQIPQQFPYVVLGNFVVMPNHVHGILEIDKSDMTVGLSTATDATATATATVVVGRDAINRVSTVATRAITVVTTHIPKSTWRHYRQQKPDDSRKHFTNHPMVQRKMHI